MTTLTSTSKPKPAPISTSTTPSTPKSGRTRRLSRFTEGSETTRPEIEGQTPTTNELFFTILSQMDAHEDAKQARNRLRGGSNSSVESFTSSAAATSPTIGTHEGTRSITFGRGHEMGARRSLDAGGSGGDGSGLKSIVKGRLRALTGERRKDVVKPYHGT